MISKKEILQAQIILANASIEKLQAQLDELIAQEPKTQTN